MSKQTTCYNSREHACHTDITTQLITLRSLHCQMRSDTHVLMPEGQATTSQQALCSFVATALSPRRTCAEGTLQHGVLHKYHAASSHWCLC
jgi:hypothetical protein